MNNTFRKIMPNCRHISNQHSIGVIMVFMMGLLGLCLSQVISIHRYLQTAGYSLTQAEYIFSLISCGANMPYSSILFLLLMKDSDPFQKSGYLINEKRYALRRIIRCFFMSFMMAILIVIFTFILTFPIANKKIIWTEPLMMPSRELVNTIIPNYIFETQEPLSAIMLAFGILFLFWFSSSLFLNTMSQVNATYLGLMVYVVGVNWNSIWFGEWIPSWFPVRCYTLNAILRNAEIGTEYHAICQGFQYLIIGAL